MKLKPLEKCFPTNEGSILTHSYSDATVYVVKQFYIPFSNLAILFDCFSVNQVMKRVPAGGKSYAGQSHMENMTALSGSSAVYESTVLYVKYLLIMI